jgi:hypothetical protein
MGRRAQFAVRHREGRPDVHHGDHWPPTHEIAPLLAIDPPLEVWGLHGAEHVFPNGRRELDLPPSATQVKLDDLRAILERNCLGGRFENKANGVVMHWRDASRRQAKLIE